MSFVGGVGYSNIDLIYSGLDRLPDKGEEIFARGFSMQFGGGIPATMINLSRLGVESRIITFAGHDLFSEFVKNIHYQQYVIENVEKIWYNIHINKNIMFRK